MTTRLRIPEIDFDELFKNCTSNIQDKDERNRARIIGYKSIIKENNNNYVSSMKDYKKFNEQFFLPNNSEEYTIFKRDMSWLYTNKFVNKNSKGREYYDLIKSNVTNKRCPYCLHSDIDDLDHYLPKSVYPSLSLTTENLVPACKTCNTKKSKAEELFPHPYFDAIDKYTFIRCNTSFEVDVGGILFIYEIDKSALPSKLFTKIKNFADITGRLDIYSVHAASEFNVQKRSFIGLLKYGKQCLEDNLKDVLDGEELVLGKNCWQAAFYRCLLENIDELYKYLEIIQMEQRLGK